MLEAVEAALEHGVSTDAIDGALGPISLDHDDGAAHTLAQAERVKVLVSDDPREVARREGKKLYTPKTPCQMSWCAML